MNHTSQPPLPRGEGEQRIGRVERKSQGVYHVRIDERLLPCAISSLLRKRLVYSTADPASVTRRVQRVEDIREADPVAIGDEVRLTDTGDGGGFITEVLPRRSKLSRKAAGSPPREQVIIANADQYVVVMSGCTRPLKWNLVDRHLVVAELAGVTPLVCLTKMDLAEETDLMEEVGSFRALGYRVLLTSALTGRGIDDLREATRDKVSVLVGQSGVGKSSLLNAVEPGLAVRVQAISDATGKGTHTTTQLQLYKLARGGELVDTPGMREFGFWGQDGEELAACFPEMRPYLDQCRFGVCTHVHEPGCAIRQAVSDGQVSRRRYESYLKMRSE